MPQKHPIGSTFILIGTSLGAGMLALPLISAKAGFLSAALLMVIVWALMTLSALLVLEVCLALKPYHNNFGSMAKSTLGKNGQIVAWIFTLLLLYTLTSAYIDGSTSLIGSILNYLFHFRLPRFIEAFSFTLFFALFVTTSTHAVDLLNRGLMSLKGITLIGTLVLLAPQIQFTHLIASSSTHSSLLIDTSIIFLTSFGFHNVIPSIVNYQGTNTKLLRNIILMATTTTLAVYLLWLSCTLGIIPLVGQNSFQTILSHKGNVDGLIDTLNALTRSPWVHAGINSFANIAMTTSFLGVTLGLFDFLADGFKRKNNAFGRIQTALLTFTPPFVIAMTYPKLFVIALEYAGLCVAVLLVVMPAMMAYQLRKSPRLTSPYRVFGGQGILAFVFFLGMFFITMMLWQLI